MVTLEQVEKLKERANVSYDEAKAALEATGGDLLEALIYLEKQGKVKAPRGNGFYSSAEEIPRDSEKQARGEFRGADRGESFSGLLKRIGRFCLKLIQKGNSNTFEVLKGNECKASIPVTVLVLLLVFAFWVSLPLMIVGLFFDLRYRFQGPDLGKDSVNHAMDSVANATDDLKKSICDDKK
ncbi:ubiquitin [Clostridium sp. W14A]|nr:ubiquitin [Clostridium sp. W14A]